MRIGLIDTDSHNYPNLALMKIASYHFQQGDDISWYDSLSQEKYDKVYASKVFSFTKDYDYYINAEQTMKGGTGYAISLQDGREVYDETKDTPLPQEIEHIRPMTSIYWDRIPETRDTAYGFISRGCPRGCDFCIVAKKEGKCSRKVADLDEWYSGQKNIELLDPNILALPERERELLALKKTGAKINFNQGLDARFLTQDICNIIKDMNVSMLHFAWDKYNDEKIILKNLKMLKNITGWDKRKITVYTITNFDTTIEQDIDRVMKLKEIGVWPYIMIYDKEHLPKGHIIKRLQRWVNNRFLFETIPTFDEYMKSLKQGKIDDRQMRLFNE